MKLTAILLSAILLSANIIAQPDRPRPSVMLGVNSPLDALAQFTEAGAFASIQYPIGTNATLTPSLRLGATYFPSDYEVIDENNPAAFMLQIQADLRLPGDLDAVYLLGSGGGALTYSATTANNWRGAVLAGTGLGFDFDIGKHSLFLEGRYLYAWVDKAQDWKMIPVGLGLRF